MPSATETNSCCLGCYTKQDNETNPTSKSVAQTFADITNCFVLSPGGYSQPAFSDYMKPHTTEKYDKRSLEERMERWLKEGRGENYDFAKSMKDKFYNSADDTWYLSIPANADPGLVGEIYTFLFG